MDIGPSGRIKEGELYCTSHLILACKGATEKVDIQKRICEKN
jgi:hypothetical protein